jgi:hypothetical protein
VDLKDERARVQNMIMQLGYIPAGMELFPAIDEEQLEFIKRIIDDSNYYLLIIGGRYGSVGKDGISCTEKEYDYAVSKEMKVIALVHANPKALSLEKSEKDAKARRSLEKFRKNVLQGRMVLFWNDASELPGQLAQSLPVTIKAYPAVGWVRADSVPGKDIYKELNDLRKENNALKQALHGQNQFVDTHKIAGLNDPTSITLRTAFDSQHPQKIDTTWGEIFYNVATLLLLHAPDKAVRMRLSDYFRNKLIDAKYPKLHELDARSMTAIRIQFRALDLINIFSGEIEEDNKIVKTSIWSLTTTGERLLVLDKASRRADEQ